jgi:hypothetical protein
MRYLALGVALAGLSVAAVAQSSAWGFFNGDNGTMGAGVQSVDGAQLLLKCDKVGKHQVFAVVAANSVIAAPLPSNRFESQPVTVRVDGKPTWNDNWRFYDKFALAVDQGNTRSLTRLLSEMKGGSKLTIELKPVKFLGRTYNFDIAGAADAAAKVYEGCKDDNPLAAS